MFGSTLMAWGGFLAFVLLMLCLDLFVLHRKPHEIRFREALIGVLLPVGMALAFIAAVYYAYDAHWFNLGIPPESLRPESRGRWPTTGGAAALMYLTGYIVEISLSADNVFLFVVLMNFFAVPLAYQHRVLFWGVLGALVMRGVMIVLGGAVIAQFHGIIYVFGAFLIFTGIKMLLSGEEEADPANNLAVRIARTLFPVTRDYHGKAFFIHQDHAGKVRLMATPLFLVLVCVEFTDVIFAVDSIPAIFGITEDTFIVFTSNVFAILGLRSMYFLLAGVMGKFHHLKIGLSLVLAFVGIKMLLPLLGHYVDPADTVPDRFPWLFEEHWGLNMLISLGFIVGVLAISIVTSLAWPKKERDPLYVPEGTKPPRKALKNP